MCGVWVGGLIQENLRGKGICGEHVRDEIEEKN